MGNLTYRSAGVDADAQDDFAEAIGRMVASARPPEVVSGIGGFAAAFAPDLTGMTRPLLVSGTDGVGTKLKLAFQTGIHHTVGIDLVAMCVNDVLTTGAKPLFFLDYFACGRLQKAVSLKVVEGVVEGCRQAGCALVGGETAEMPGFYADGEYDLAGFSVGLVDQPRMLPAGCSDGDVLVGLPSTGVHSNGFSLVRRIIDHRGLDLGRVYEDFDRPLGEVLLTPTRIYVKPILDLIASVEVHALAHITGGGIEGNLPRVLPEGLHAIVDRAAIPRPPVFPFLQGADVDDAEMWSVFNMGTGLIVAMPPAVVDRALARLAAAGLAPFVMGRLAAGGGDVAWT
jgi:phosphoribosylformylglycinamidine cyclo-ligase